jgi:hypothetical protein
LEESGVVVFSAAAEAVVCLINIESVKSNIVSNA